METERLYGRDAKKMTIFEVKLWPTGKRTRLHFWMGECSNCVEHTEKEIFYCTIVTHTFLRLGHPALKFRQTCTITQNSWFLEVLNVVFEFLIQKPCQYQFLRFARHKKRHFLMTWLRGLSQHTWSLKSVIFWKQLGVTSSNF